MAYVPEVDASLPLPVVIVDTEGTLAYLITDGKGEN